VSDQVNWHAEAIAVLAGELDYRALVYAIARRDPRTLVETFRGVCWADQVERQLRAGISKIEAIKLARSLAGLSLKDAKDGVEALMTRLGIQS